MIIQTTAVLENQPGRLSQLLNALKEAGVDLNGISIAESVDYGLCRMILSDTEAGRTALVKAGFFVQSTQVLAVEVKDRPGALAQVFTDLAGEGINVQYVYAFGTKAEGHAMIIVKPDDIQKAISCLEEAGNKVLSKKEMEERLNR